MPTILCEVYHCLHNKDGGCCLNYIKVDGNNAEYSEGTACDSYADEYDSPAKDQGFDERYPCDNSDIDCSAEKCIYNDNHICVAEGISVGGSFAESTGETECETFVTYD